MKANEIKVEHYIFDFDGTLVDSMPYWAGAMLNVIKSYGVSFPENIISIVTPLGIPATVKYFQSLGAPKNLEEIVRDVDSQLSPMYRDVIPLKEGVGEKLRELKASGKGLHVLTASPHRWLDACLKRNGVWDLFDNIWSCDDFTATKADPKIYQMAAERIGADIHKVAFLDDNINADTAAHESGIVTIGVYDETSKDQRAQFESVCDAYIDSFAEL